jgi:hypothetical protein
VIDYTILAWLLDYLWLDDVLPFVEGICLKGCFGSLSTGTAPHSCLPLRGKEMNHKNLFLAHNITGSYCHLLGRFAWRDEQTSKETRIVKIRFNLNIFDTSLGLLKKVTTIVHS